MAIAATLGYCTVEYIWPAVKRRFFRQSDIQKRLQISEQISLTKYEEEIALAGAIHPSQIDASFEDVGGHGQIIDELVDNLAMMLRDKKEDPELAHLVGSKLYQPPSGILLYGPPGCGKTLLAKALAAEAGARFINVPLALLFDKWVGETEKYLEALFSLAQKIQPCIIFIDEIESLTRRRSELDSGWSSTMKSQFLTLWDGLLSNRQSKRIVLLGATNRRQDIDEAFLRRMPLQMRVSLPDAQQRIQILRVLLSDVKTKDDMDLEMLADRMAGLSGSDMREICRRVVMGASLSGGSKALGTSDFLPVITRFIKEQSRQ